MESISTYQYSCDFVDPICARKEETVRNVAEIEANTNRLNSDHSQGNTSFFMTCFNGINVLSGVGILSTPYALASGGWWSIILLFLIASIAFHTGLLIQKCMDTDPTIKTYPDIGQRAFGHIGRKIASVFMYSELYLVATGFLILEGDNLHNLLPHFNLQIAGLDPIDGKKSFIVIVALVILPSVWLDNLSILAYISTCGVIASGVILGSVSYVGGFDGVGFHAKGTQTPASWKGVPTAISLYTFCYGAHPVFPTLYNSMRNIRQFPKVLLLCFLCSTFFYAAMAIVGYLMFGSNVQSLVTLNLPTSKISSKVAQYTTLINPISKYALLVTPIVHAAKNRFPCSQKNKWLTLVIGTALVLSSVIVALAFPFFGYLMSLGGAFLSATASIILPCLCYLKISGGYRKLDCKFAANVVVILIGAAVGILGTYTSIVQIIEKL